MKALIVAHPDDEILWFNPNYFDLIIIVFCMRKDRPSFAKARLAAIANHPFNAKIKLLNIDESGYWKDKTKINEYMLVSSELNKHLTCLAENTLITEIYTHNFQGEYGHADHMLVHNEVMRVFTDKCKVFCPTKYISNEFFHYIQMMEMDLHLFKKIKDIYIQNKAWTWSKNFQPNSYERYYMANYHA